MCHHIEPYHMMTQYGRLGARIQFPIILWFAANINSPLRLFHLTLSRLLFILRSIELAVIGDIRTRSLPWFCCYGINTTRLSKKSLKISSHESILGVFILRNLPPAFDCKFDTVMDPGSLLQLPSIS